MLQNKVSQLLCPSKDEEDRVINRLCVQLRDSPQFCFFSPFLLNDLVAVPKMDIKYQKLQYQVECKINDIKMSCTEYPIWLLPMQKTYTREFPLMMQTIWEDALKETVPVWPVTRMAHVSWIPKFQLDKGGETAREMLTLLQESYAHSEEAKQNDKYLPLLVATYNPRKRYPLNYLECFVVFYEETCYLVFSTETLRCPTEIIYGDWQEMMASAKPLPRFFDRLQEPDLNEWEVAEQERKEFIVGVLDPILGDKDNTV